MFNLQPNILIFTAMRLRILQPPPPIYNWSLLNFTILYYLWCNIYYKLMGPHNVTLPALCF